ncbi:MAG: hypothetical protein C0501_06200 [Isosphaera sp.]|nr:hypothetical protein [Isosphaera sp.]
MSPRPLGLLLLALCPPAAAGTQAPPPPARTVRELAADRAPRPVALTGVVTHVDAHRNEFWVQDATGGAAVRGAPVAGLRPGDRVEVEGESDPAAFAPAVRAEKVKRLGPGALPEPLPFDLTPAAARESAGRWVRATVRVHGASTGSGFTRLEVDSVDGVGAVLVPGEEHAARAAGLRGAVVEVRGVCEPGSRGGRLSGRPRVYAAALPGSLPSGPPAPEAVAALADRLLRPVRDPLDRLRAKVAGVVTAAPVPGVLVVQDPTGGMTVSVRSPGDAIPVGTRVEAEGLLRDDGGRPGLARATVTRLGPAAYPGPVATAAADLAARAGLVVRTAGTVEAVRDEDGWTALTLSDGPDRFEAFAPGRPGENGLGGVRSGSRVEVVGVPVRLNGTDPDGVYLPDPGAVAVTAGPVLPGWWETRPAAFLAGGVLAGAAGGAWVWVLGARVRRRDGEMAGLEERLREAQRLETVGRLAAGVAHDFNNQLTVIIGCAELAAGAGAGRVADLVDNIRRAADRAADLTTRLLTYSRRRDAAVTAVDLNHVVTETVRLLDRVLGAHVRIDTDLAPDLPPVRGEFGLLHQLLMNLAVNARDAMPGGGTLTFTTARVGDPARAVRLAVADTGEGMSDAVKARVFEPFFTTKGPGKGTGLGLAAVSGVVASLGGTVRVESAVGRGTRFEIDLRPAGGPAPAADPTVRTPLPAGRLALRPRLAGVTVLVVEDDEEVRDLLAAGLAGDGAAVLSVPRPDQALEDLAARPSAVDVLVTDVVLPGMGGPELAARVRAARPGVRVVFVSGHPAEEVLAGPPDGGVEFLQKPFTPEQLTARVLRVLGRG